jgi:pSer/pThr/pTyr-binding forkhead associated (FHA) protein
MSDPHRTQMLTQDPNRTQLGGTPSLDPNKTIMGPGPTLNATQTIKPIQCPVCKAFNPAGVMFCIDCGLIFDRALPDDAFGAPAVQLPMLIDESGREHPIRPGTTVLGREGDIALVDGRISRRHAQIDSSDQGLLLSDLGSTNGTKVNDNPVSTSTSVTITGGDKISLGGFVLQVQLPGTKGGNVTQAFASNKTAAMATPPTKEVPPAVLVANDGKEHPLKLGMNTFGRKSENDVAISDAYVSGKHGIIEVAEDGLYLTDIGSTNGTLLNDAKLAPNMRTRLEESDEIRLGSLTFRIRRSVES